MPSLSLPPGVPIFFGRPDVPLPEEVSDAIAKAVVMVPGLAEAHMPQCFIRGVTKEAQRVLAVVLTPDADPEQTLTALEERLKPVVPPGLLFNLLTIGRNSESLEDLRQTECSILWTEHAPKLRRRPWRFPFGIPTVNVRIQFSRPPRPLPGFQLRLITSLVASIPGIAEAHLPQCFVPEVMKAPQQALILVVRPDVDDRDVVEAVEKGLAALMRDDETLEIWTLPATSSMLHALRRTNVGLLQARASGERR